MWDSKTRTMLEAANELTAEDLEWIRTGTVLAAESVASAPVATVSARPEPANEGLTAGARERLRTRESKVSTAALGTEREKHEWWPVGTKLIGHIGAKRFTAEVVENPKVKSGCSVLITSGDAQGKVCNTPTRAALEATEVYRQTANLGRAGGVTNGWTFWQVET